MCQDVRDLGNRWRTQWCYVRQARASIDGIDTSRRIVNMQCKVVIYFESCIFRNIVVNMNLSIIELATIRLETHRPLTGTKEKTFVTVT